MIKYNNSNINDWYYDTSNIIKVYRNNAVCYYKISDTPPTPPTPTFKWLATYVGGTTSSAECDSTSAITNGEITLSNLVSVEIGDCVTSIGEGAFYSCFSLTNVAIGSGVTSIGMGAFNSCTSLTSITIPDSVTSIGDGVFGGCSFTSINIPSGVTSIGSSAFFYCNSLTSITVNAITPPTLGNNVFDNTNNCPIYVPSGSVDTYKEARGWSSYASRITCPPFEGKFKATYSDSHTESAECDSSSAITEGEISITNLVSVEIGGTCVISIDDYAFADCMGLTSIDIPDSVTSIGTSAFDSCFGLTNVTIGSGVTSIGNSAFFYCNSLTSITVNATTPPTLGTNVFYNTNDCPIYVPSESVDTYKEASRWSSYASRIQAIPS